jgi:hypothetical protein
MKHFSPGDDSHRAVVGDGYVVRWRRAVLLLKVYTVINKTSMDGHQYLGDDITPGIPLLLQCHQYYAVLQTSFLLSFPAS